MLVTKRTHVAWLALNCPTCGSMYQSLGLDAIFMVVCVSSCVRQRCVVRACFPVTPRAAKEHDILCVRVHCCVMLLVYIVLPEAIQ